MYHNNIVQHDLAVIAREQLDWQRFHGKTVLITGAYSMLGTYLALFLIYLNREHGIKVSLKLLGRNMQRMQHLFGKLLDSDCEFLCQDVTAPINTDEADFIFHFAGNCNPHYIKTDPVGIMRCNLMGTFSVMELARRCKSERVILASTREVYGDMNVVTGDHNCVSEHEMGVLDPMDDRSCYPEGKRAEETIARSYYLQHGVPFNSVRLAHVYGPGMRTEGDGRVMSDFIADAIAGRDIVLKSDGTAVRAFCYISDAISGMMHVAQKGSPGEAYNLSNECEPSPIGDVAQMVCNASRHDIKVVKHATASNTGYCNYQRTALNNAKIQQLGFTPRVTLTEGIAHTLHFFEQ